MKNIVHFICVACLLLTAGDHVSAQITDRQLPAEWQHLVRGGRFMDRFLPMPAGISAKNVWGAEVVIPRYVDNGVEDSIYSYWGGNIVRDGEGKYHLFVCAWLESSPGGHMEWPNSSIFHAVADKPEGPFKVKDKIGKGHNPEIFRLQDGRYVIYVINGRYVSDRLDGGWSFGTFEFDKRNRPIIEGLSNLTFARREDGSFLMVCRGGGIWISENGLSPYCQLTDRRVYPDVAGDFEDPVVWRDHVQYHLIVNDWRGRIAWYLRSGDGINWVVDPGEAYVPDISVHEDGYVEQWFKYERMKVFQDEYGRAVQANFAVIDTLKHEDRASDNHSSKNICIPLNPGLLLTMLDTQPVTAKTSTIRVKISAEKGFNPHTDIDLASLRFGASAEVNYGRGAKVKITEKAGNDLIVTFDAAGNGITDAEFAPKLIGKNLQGKLIYGYARLPYNPRFEAMLSARAPVFTRRTDGWDIFVEVQNFGQVGSAAASLTLSVQKDGKTETVGNAAIPVLKPYEKTRLRTSSKTVFEKGKEYTFRLTISTKAKTLSEYTFKAVP